MRRIKILLLQFVLAGILYSAPPAPGVQQSDQSFGGVSEIRGGFTKRAVDLPDSILVLRVQFSDVEFDEDPAYPPGNPDVIPHDDAYFERFMYHLSSFWQDASKGAYEISSENYYLFPEVFTLSREMAYYGDNDLSTERISEFLVELLDMADAMIDFNDYDSFIIFHAGAGEESDISGQNEADLWTTFVTRKTLQAGLDPENDEFPGLQYDGKILKEFVIAPETQRQPDIQNGDPLFGVLGVLCHEYGRLLGLPTLYDNQSSNGKSAGIGNYGVMGTGLWNAAGYVPSLPCAWSRLYMGWSQCLEIDANAEGMELTYPMNTDSTAEIYKVKISEDEYFLLENRQQNPDKSYFVNLEGDTLATFSFEIVENQEYYPEGHAYAGQPYFNFMNNTYAGCEWDFYLPGYGEGDALSQDGSGICIWHVDENVMREKFNPEEEINVPNGEEEHKAIDLEEADHSQDMDNYGMYGGRDDTYRAGNNDYFGFLEHNGLYWTPTAESYYGGIRLEIYDISYSDSVMSFSVRYEWLLDAGTNGINSYPAGYLEYNDATRLVYVSPDCEVKLWENNLIVAEEVILRDTIPQCWSWLSSREQLLVPAQYYTASSLHCYNDTLGQEEQLLFTDSHWAAPALVANSSNTAETRIVLGFNNVSNAGSHIEIYDSDWQHLESLEFAEKSIKSNLMYNGGKFHFALLGEAGLQICSIDLYGAGRVFGCTASVPDHAYMALLMEQVETAELDIYMSGADSLVYKFSQQGNAFEYRETIELPFICDSYPSTGDLTGDGLSEIIWGGENSFCAINLAGDIIKPSSELSLSDSTGICAGVIVVDVEGDGRMEVAGSMSKNRFCIWENINDNEWRIKRDYPVSYGQRSRNYPLVRNGEIYLPSDKGKIFRNIPAGADVRGFDKVEYADLERTAYVQLNSGENEHESQSFFVESETYVYPNPYSSIFDGVIVNGFRQSGKIGIRVMLSERECASISVYDIAGNLVNSGSMELEPYIAETWLLDAETVSSGVYTAQIRAGGKSKLIKFAIEK